MSLSDEVPVDIRLIAVMGGLMRSCHELRKASAQMAEASLLVHDYAKEMYSVLHELSVAVDNARDSIDK